MPRSRAVVSWLRPASAVTRRKEAQKGIVHNGVLLPSCPRDSGSALWRLGIGDFPPRRALHAQVVDPKLTYRARLSRESAGCCRAPRAPPGWVAASLSQAKQAPLPARQPSQLRSWGCHRLPSSRPLLSRTSRPGATARSREGRPGAMQAGGDAAVGVDGHRAIPR
jgi:hypothetical protein